MIQVEKIKNIFHKDENKNVIDNNNQALDFFKTSNLRIRKSNKIKKIISIAVLLISSGYIYSSILENNRINKLISDYDKAEQIFTEINNNLIKNNTVNISSFEELTKTSSGHGSSRASMIVWDILHRDYNEKFHKNRLSKNYKKLDPHVQAKILKIFDKNWNYGITAEKFSYSNCRINAFCHLNKNFEQSNLEELEKEIQKTVIHVQHPDIFAKQMDVDILKSKHKKFYN